MISANPNKLFNQL